ncbi:MAG: peptidase S8, partial [Phaeodactylibacter sp.]|nr:peptidase S8 [Phaeodactylibacter sp.]
MMKYKSLLLVAAGLLAFTTVFGQGDKAPENWFNLDAATDGVQGVSTEKMYKELLAGKKGETVIVAVIDSGVDSEHEDLKEVMWVNEDEIPNNGIDDDKNGYVDDIPGWNFIGGKNRKNVAHDTYEATRLLGLYDEKFADANPDKLSKKEKEEYDLYKKLKKDNEATRADLESKLGFYENLMTQLQDLKKAIGKDDFTQEDLSNFEAPDEQTEQSVAMLSNIMMQLGTLEEVEE